MASEKTRPKRPLMPPSMRRELQQADDDLGSAVRHLENLEADGPMDEGTRKSEAARGLRRLWAARWRLLNELTRTDEPPAANGNGRGEAE